MSRQFWQEALTWAVASGTAVANTGTETILFPNVTIPANYMQDGRVLQLNIFGAWGNTTGPPTLTFAIRWGGVAGTVLAKTGAIITTASQGGGASMTALWNLQAFIQTRSNGSSGTLMTNGNATLFSATVPTGGTITNYGMVAPLVSGATGGSTPVVATVDLTSDTALSVTALWGTGATANSIQGLNYTLEAMN